MEAPKRLSIHQAGFDPRWPHPRNPKTGAVVAHNQYRRIDSQVSEGKGTISRYEFPINSGIFYRRSDHPDGAIGLELDEEASKVGLEKKAVAEKFAKRSALEKADAALKAAKDEFERAQAEASGEAKANLLLDQQAKAALAKAEQLKRS